MIDSEDVALLIQKSSICRCLELLDGRIPHRIGINLAIGTDMEPEIKDDQYIQLT